MFCFESYSMKKSPFRGLLKRAKEKKRFLLELPLSEELYPGQGALPFVKPGFIRTQVEWVGLPGDTMRFVLETAAMVADDPDLSRVAWHHYHQLYHADQRCTVYEIVFPKLDDVLREYEFGYYLLLALAGAPEMRALHKEKQVPEQITRETLRDFTVWTEHFKEAGMGPGISKRILGWLQLHLQGRLYRLGRLQFLPGSFHGPVKVFRNRTSGACQALAENGMAFNEYGQVDGVDEVTSAKAWIATLDQSEIEVCGYPVSKQGHAEQKPIVLRRDAWECVLQDGDPMLEVQIPDDSAPPARDECLDAFRNALDFFPRYMPLVAFKGFMCTSWLMDIQYQQLLPADSGIVRFQNLFHRFPVAESGREHVYRVFGNVENIKRLRREDLATSLQRTVYDFITAGGHLREGGGYIFREEILTSLDNLKKDARYDHG